MSDIPPTTEDIEAAILADIANGVQSFSDGTNNVSMTDPERRLEALRLVGRYKGEVSATKNPSFGLRFTKINGPAGGFQ